MLTCASLPGLHWQEWTGKKAHNPGIIHPSQHWRHQASAAAGMMHTYTSSDKT